jgi:Fe-S oxidoreductase
MGKLKQEWQYQYYKDKRVPFRSWLIGYFAMGMRLASRVPWGYRLVFGNAFLSNVAKGVMGFARKRSMPSLSGKSWTNWFKNDFVPSVKSPKKSVYIFIDELLDYNEAEVGITAVRLLDKLGYAVKYVAHKESGRSFLSKGLLKQAKRLATENVAVFSKVIGDATPLIGVEPSAILTFRDEYPDLLRGEDKENAKRIAANTFLIEEFLAQELDAGAIDVSAFKHSARTIKLHGHCQQKALSSLTPVKKILTIMGGNEVHLIRSGCCGMAGSFGYEREHYDLSMKIGELFLFPAIRKQAPDVLIAAAGTSCRHQVKDGTGRTALHPVEILWNSLQ